MYRTHNCNQLTKKDIEKIVTLSGWVHRKRDHGGIIFIDLRDREGLTQLVFDPNENKKVHMTAAEFRSEDVIKIEGKVRQRPKGMINKNIATGEIEVLVNGVEVLSKSEILPFEIEQETEVAEELRLQYRYLDLRRERMKHNIIMRHKIIKRLRDFMDFKGFIEIETPIMIKGTPEGSREYSVPSRLHPGKFYVLPQSPQQLKQLLMVACFDKYFQIARCFRDEDQRGDRQPEFTQLDIEMSFVEENDVMKINEEAMIDLVEGLLSDKKIQKKPFPKLTFKDAMDRFGSDKPDLRFGMEIKDVSEIVRDSDFQLFAKVVKDGGVVKALRIEGGAKLTLKEINEFEEVAKIYGAKGLAYIMLVTEGPKSSIVKFFKKEELKAIFDLCEAKTGDIVFFSADKFKTACEAIGQVRLAYANKNKLRDPSIFAFCWITDFPMFEWSKEDNRIAAMHHPFTHPKEEDISLLEKDPLKVRAKAYDLVLNGCELGGGSIRIHDAKLQSRIFDILGISKKEAERRFGHLLKAFKYGAPPHGGIAWGLDRVVMLFCNEPNIREVIPFPKDQKARCLMTGAPSELPKEQIKEMHVEVKI